jgi:tetratricopeptide (TPR) repeat protein
MRSGTLPAMLRGPKQGSTVVKLLAMKPALIFVFILVCSAAVSRLDAQSQPPNQMPGSDQKQPPAAAQPNRTEQQTNQNPFPEDTSSVPLMPSRDNPNVPIPTGESGARLNLPDDDLDPVRSPDEAGAAAETVGSSSSSSSSLAGMPDLLPGSDDDTTQPGRRGKKSSAIAPEHHETAAEDENVGAYYLDNKDWKAALSRFQSAMVLDPDNPDVYWGLAESDRHLGNLADARAYYQKVVDYDPDSHHGKDARKALKDPEIANAKATAQPAPAHPSLPAPQ